MATVPHRCTRTSPGIRASPWDLIVSSVPALATACIDYITLMTSTALYGLFVAAMLDAFGPTTSILGGTAPITTASESCTAFFPSLRLPCCWREALGIG